MNKPIVKPMYEVIFDAIKNKIEDGTYLPGSQIPTEKEIADQFEVSRITSKKAYDLLVAGGFIYRHAGRGSFVQDENNERIHYQPNLKKQKQEH
ncbi:GntR family transcriptional regulator [Paenibacillus albus]|uniref:GntR family transcriptional regulator n=1 Tax=Paenibacillus albus TaxID=2495582 RepID=A0A3Q8X4P6_9BACL|nr:winged helix-turn-helix domain-containing protein [Paenibacillus albus]AZN40325.1 GntR family transcriptional regulator [Paenibacillus albus]